MSEQKWSESGQRGSSVSSDCWVRFEPREEGGIVIDLKSKVEAMYGPTIREDVQKVVAGLAIEHAHLSIEDAGALPFVIAARVETAIKRFFPDLKQSYFPDIKEFCLYGTTRDRFRRSRLYLPGNEPKFFLNAGVHQPDGIILDLEDSVSSGEKDAARIMVRNSLRQVNFFGAERMVRINQLPLGFRDLEEIVHHNVHLILIPKVEDAAQVVEVDAAVRSILGSEEGIYLMPIIESARGAFNAFSIASAVDSIVALTIGLEDYTADIGAERTKEGRESFWARCQVLNAAKAAGVQAIDTVFSDVGDMDGLYESVLEAKSLGFDGKGCIHPRQIDVVHEAFAPKPSEVEKACKIVKAFDEAQSKGLGVVSLGRKMIDPPVVKRALRTVELAIATGHLSVDWKGKNQD